MKETVGNMLAIDKLIVAIDEKKNATMAGLDTQVAHLPEGFVGADAPDAEVAAAIGEYNKKVIEAIHDIVPAVKIQIAYYEMYGLEGMKAYKETLDHARKHGLIVCTDAKRNDIGATAAAYAKAYLNPNSQFYSDFLTLNGYLGLDGIQPFIDEGERSGSGVFVLVKTSNPSGGDLQDKLIDGREAFYHMGQLVHEWGRQAMGTHGYSSVGAVVGATYAEQGLSLRAQMPHTFFLVPGYGAQGGTGEDIKKLYDSEGRGLVVNASRTLLTAHQQNKSVGYAEAIRAEALRMRADIAPNQSR